MKILGRIKKSKVLTAVMTAVLILQSACPTGLAYAAEQARSSAVLTVTASVEDLDETLPTVQSPTDFTAGSAVGTCPAYWTAHEDGTSFVESLAAKKQKQGLALNWYDEDTGAKFDWYKTKVTKSTSVIGKWEKYDVSVTFSANDGTTKSDTETVPYGQSYKQAFGKEKAAPATRKGYEFDGWYDSSTNKKFDFTVKLTDPTVSVYAKWNLKDAVEVAPTDASRPAQTATGTCTINGTWFGSPFEWGSIARFNLSNFTGELAGASMNDAQCVDSGAENPYLAGRRTASYQATLASFDETTGKAVYDVYVYPAGHATGDMYVKRPPYPASQGTQQGVQRIHATATVYKVVKGYIELQKASTCTNVSDNNKLYSLAGAEFSIYDASGKFVQKLTTNEKGETGRSGLLTAGTYTVKETKAPEGYYAADDFTVTVNAGQVTKKTVGDKPYDDPMYMLVGKFDGEKTYNGAGNLPQGSATLADAEFTVDYYDTFDYDNYDDLKKADIEPTHSWTFKTDEDGFSYFDAEHFVSAIKDGTELVAFETVSSDEHEICAHADIEDEGQTVTVTKPEVGTTATDGFDGDKNVVADTDVNVVDTVHYKNLTPGKTYKVTGTLYQKVTDKDGKVTKKKLTVDGKDVTAETEFTAETSDGDATVTFKFDASGIKDKTPLVAFESLSYKDKELCAHADIEDEDQTVTVNQPSVGTTATDKLDGDKTVIADAESSVTDEVAYDHVLTGKSYTMAGILMDAKTGLPVLTGEGAKKFTEDDLVKFTTGLLDVLGFKSDSDEDGIDWSAVKSLPTASIDLSKVTAYAEENKELLSCLVYQTAEFTPEKESGSIDMDYTFNSNDVIDRLSGETKNLVVFEVMFKGSIENASDETPVSIVASECDKDNEGQTVKLAPSTIGTTATDKSDGDHELMAGKDAVITDEVKYEGLIPGKEYTLHATLMDKKTGEPLKVADKGVTAELKFTPNSESGTVSINLGEFDATSLDGHTLVVFEELTKQSDIDGKTTDVTVAEHKDINDEGQSVTVTSTPAGSTYGKTGVDMTNIAIAIGILLIAAGCATAYGIKSRKTTKGDADESAEDNTEA